MFGVAVLFPGCFRSCFHLTFVAVLEGQPVSKMFPNFLLASVSCSQVIGIGVSWEGCSFSYLLKLCHEPKWSGFLIKVQEQSNK